MDTNAFSDEFVTAVNQRGEKQVIPAHWIDHPVLGAGFRLPASAHSTPSLAWTREQLDTHAAGLGIYPGEYPTKKELLDAIEHHQTPTPDQGEDETPAAGDDKEN